MPASLEPGDLAALTDLLGPQAFRLHGPSTWADVALLGSSNLARLLDLCRERAAGLLQGDSPDASERRALSSVLARLSALAENGERKPLLPRLRIEHFRVGDEVALFVGDSPSARAGAAWEPALIVAVDKAFEPSWASAEPNSGYFWRLTARAARPLFTGGSCEARFSTSEPRALLAPELRALRAEAAAGSRFFALWCENARRDFTPLWCLERNERIDPALVDFASWLARPAV